MPSVSDAQITFATSAPIGRPRPVPKYRMPNGIATNAWDLTLRFTSTNGTIYTKKVSASVGGMVRINNR